MQAEDNGPTTGSEEQDDRASGGGGLPSGVMPWSVSTSREEELCGLLHDLNNVLVCVLLNAQIMARRLPSYSHMKRNLHEVERSAQRGGVLVRRLRNWFQNGKGPAGK